jgi:hypothetical protein
MKVIETKLYVCERTGSQFPTESLARVSENRLPKAKIAELKRRIKLGKKWTPIMGDVIYVRTSISCDHGETDVAGGLALVTGVTKGMSGGNPNTPFVEVAQHDGGGYNWEMLFRDQKELMKRHGDEVAHPDPDYGPSLYDPHEWQ